MILLNRSNFFIFLLIIFTFGSQTDAEVEKLTPSQLYILTHDFSRIEERLDETHLQFYFSIIEHEKEEGFFGYHATTQNHRVFQDILKAVVEEIFGYQVPRDFQFLRIPGADAFNFPNQKCSFYQTYDRQSATDEMKSEMIYYFFLEPYNQAFQTHAGLWELSAEDKDVCWKVILGFLEDLDSRAVWECQDYTLGLVRKNGMKKKSPRELLKKLIKSTEPRDQIIPKAVFPSALEESLASIFAKLHKAHIRHEGAAVSSLWVKLTMQFHEMLKKTDQILYTYGYRGMEKFFFPYNDTYDEQQRVLLSMNIPLFGNYHRFDESTTFVFSGDSSIEGGDSRLTDLLKTFFDEIGIDPLLVDQLKGIAVEELERAGNQTGCILQFFDQSNTAGRPGYSFVDENAFVSFDFGIPRKEIPPSGLVRGDCPLQYKEIDLQLRLITSNNSTLNPFGELKILRHDLQPPESSSRILERMKGVLRAAEVDQDKAALYKAKLEFLWFH